jgi:hypothetical protein
MKAVHWKRYYLARFTRTTIHGPFRYWTTPCGVEHPLKRASRKFHPSEPLKVPIVCTDEPSHVTCKRCRAFLEAR